MLEIEPAATFLPRGEARVRDDKGPAAIVGRAGAETSVAELAWWFELARPAGEQ